MPSVMSSTVCRAGGSMVRLAMPFVMSSMVGGGGGSSVKFAMPSVTASMSTGGGATFGCGLLVWPCWGEVWLPHTPGGADRMPAGGAVWAPVALDGGPLSLPLPGAGVG
jgi:hypothetical protein